VLRLTLQRVAACGLHRCRRAITGWCEMYSRYSGGMRMALIYRVVLVGVVVFSVTALMGCTAEKTVSQPTKSASTPVGTSTPTPTPSDVFSPPQRRNMTV
jgi:hypothetical protein